MTAAKVTGVRTGAAAAPLAPKPDAIKPDANGIVVVTDKGGRKISLKKLKPSQRFQLAENCETKTQSGEMQAIVCASVVGIDQEGMPPVQSKQDLLDRLDELGDAGLAAITGPVLELYGIILDEKAIEAAKNS